MTEIVFPQNNEKEFIAMAEKLGTKHLYLVYSFQKNIKQYRQKLEKIKQETNTKVKLELGTLASPKDIQKAKNQCSFVITESSEKDQYVLEKQKPSLIFNLEKDPRKDRPHYRLSGLNQVLCKLASQNNITIGFSFSELLNAKPQKRAVLLGRMMQNIRFCKKYKVTAQFASFAKTPYEMRAEKDIKSLSSILQKNL